MEEHKLKEKNKVLYKEKREIERKSKTKTEMVLGLV